MREDVMAARRVIRVFINEDRSIAIAFVVWALATILGLLVCASLLSCATTYDYGRVIHEWEPKKDRGLVYNVERYWKRAQIQLNEYTQGYSLEVPHDIFRWYFVEEPFKCELNEEGEQDWCYGLFDPRDWSDIKIIIAQDHLPIIEHESCHAILFVLGRTDVCHDIYKID